ncbi:MAG: hypothetical protein SGCHY_000516 [Lobulomycetales sp.]
MEIPLAEALDESSTFHRQLAANEARVAALETTIKQISALVSSSFDAERAIAEKNNKITSLISSLDLPSGKGVSGIAPWVENIASTFQALTRSREMQMEQLQDSFLDPLSAFRERELARIQKAAKEYYSARDSYLSLLSKYMAKRTPQTGTALQKEKKRYHQHSLIYAGELNDLNTASIYEAVVGLVYARFAFYHQGFELVKDLLENTVTDLAKNLEKIRRDRLASPTMDLKSLVLTDKAYSPLYAGSKSSMSRPALVDGDRRSSAAAGEPKDSTAGKGRPLQKLDGSSSTSDPEAAPDSSVVPTNHTKLKSLTSIHEAKSGFLYKRTLGFLKTWSWARVRVTLTATDRLLISSPGELYHHTGDDSTAASSIDLRICMIRLLNPDTSPESDGRHDVFEILSPNQSIILQAVNPREAQDWISCLDAAVTRVLQGISATGEALLHSPTFPDAGRRGSEDAAPVVERHDYTHVDSSTVSTVQVLSQLAAVPGNDCCADCGETRDVDWAAVNLGVLLCITCCGTHRSLGRGISKVKSAELDTWDASTLAFMQRLGNARVNGFYEAGLARPGCTWKKPDASAGQTQRALYARKKWGEKMFCFSTVSAGAAVSAQSRLSTAVRDSNVEAIMRAIGMGADVNAVDMIGQSPLLLAVLKGDIVCADYLVFCGASVNALDRDGKACLHFAAEHGNSAMVGLLLKRNADWRIKDSSGRTPLDYALDKSTLSDNDEVQDEYVNIVTVLRLSELHSETRNSTGHNPAGLGIREALEDLKSRRSNNPSPRNSLEGRRPSMPEYARSGGFSGIQNDGGAAPASREAVELHLPDHFRERDAAANQGFASDSADPWAQSRWDDGTNLEGETEGGRADFAAPDFINPFDESKS